MNKRKKEVCLRYKVNLKKSEEGYAVWVPGLPGGWSQGKTEEEAIENIRDAINSFTMAGIIRDAGLSIDEFTS